MSFAPGARVGSYTIVAAIGAGGMGEVYRARDTKLDRDVALKVLPDAFASDPERLARFEREAKTLASLNHPHIAQIYGFEAAAGAAHATPSVLIMELVDGEDLSHRLARGPIPLDDALPIATQIAAALEAAHQQGVIHRDLKPANIKVRADGTVKVLDFGLAKALEGPGGPARAGDAALNSPTITSPVLGTISGMILGTAAYMSPEQARGKTVDRRADIWAFGAVLFEMLTGRRAFAGEEISDVLAAVLKTEPDWSALPASTPPSITRLLRRALAKDRAHRLADIADARLEIEDADRDAPAATAADRRAPQYRERLAWATAVVLAIGLLGAWLWMWRPQPQPAELRVELALPWSRDITGSFAISPDGRQIAYSGEVEGRITLWLRSLDSTSSKALPGTDDGRLPFWSPDGRSIGFFTSTRLNRLDIDGGLVRPLANILTAGGGTWHGDTILFAANSNVGPILRIPAAGGPAVPVTHPDDAQAAGHRTPHFLPDGHHFLYFALGGRDSGIFVTDLDGMPPRKLVDADSNAVYLRSRHLVFIRQNVLVAQPFDVNTLSLNGEATTVAELARGALQGVSVSDTGVIVYRVGLSAQRRQFQWVDRAGKLLEAIGSPDAAGANNPSLSPNGRRVAVQRQSAGNVDVWFLDVQRGIFDRFTSGPGIEALPIWSPDGRHVAFNSGRVGSSQIFQKAVDGDSPEEQLLVSPDAKWVTDWSPDGKTLLYRVLDGVLATHDLWALPLDGDRKPFAVIASRFDERDAQFSPDGKWIAFQSDESGRPEIYVQAFPGPSRKERISTAGGTQVRWRGDGRELFYVSPDNDLMAAAIRLPSGSEPMDVGKPVKLFSTRLAPGGSGIPRQQYVVAADGRFLLNVTTDESPAFPLNLIFNWAGGSKR